jgi:hypothetical protein
MPSNAQTPLPCEYANYKNPLGILIATHNLLMKRTRTSQPMTDDPSPRKPLTDGAKRALAEAEARRQAAAAVDVKPRQKEFQGPKGPEPTRYGDWENKGIASDF